MMTTITVSTMETTDFMHHTTVMVYMMIGTPDTSLMNTITMTYITHIHLIMPTTVMLMALTRILAMVMLQCIPLLIQHLIMQLLTLLPIQ